MKREWTTKEVSLTGFYLPIFLMLFVAKLAMFLLVVLQKADLFSLLNIGGGNDGDYYDVYARGEVEVATSLWPIFLRALNNLGLYSREGVAFALFLLGSIGVPWLVGKLVAGGMWKGRDVAQAAWSVAILVGFYPTLFFYTLDIYRDVFMLFLFLLGILLFQTAIHSSSLLGKGFWLSVFFLTAIFLFLLREYLGFSILAAWPLAKLLWRIRLSLRNVVFLVFSYFVALYVGHHTGLFAPLYHYRGPEGFEEGGSSFGIGMQGSGIQFLMSFLLTFLFQVFGLYISSAKAAGLFLIESAPIMAMLFSIWKRRLFLDGFSRYLITFSLIYATIFVLGNDNLGTAARLRMFVYVSILVVWARVSLRHGYFIRAGGLLWKVSA